MPADGIELTRLLENLADLVRLLSDVRTLEELLEIAGEHVRAGLRCASVSLSRLEPGTTTLRTLINVGDLGPTEQRWPNDETYSSPHIALFTTNAAADDACLPSSASRHRRRRHW